MENKNQEIITLAISLLLGLLLGFFIGILIFYLHSNLLKNMSYVATIIIATAAIVAVIKFFRNKKREQALSVLEQLAFFRTDVLGQFESIVEHIENKIPSHNIGSQRTGYIEIFSYSWVYLIYKEKIDIQTKLDSDEILKAKIIGMLNTMEQLSWSIILHKTTMHPALYIIHDSYIQFVEQFAHQILFSRADYPKHFEGINKIYKEWGPQISRETTEWKMKRIVEEAKKLTEEGKIKL